MGLLYIDNLKKRTGSRIENEYYDVDLYSWTEASGTTTHQGDYSHKAIHCEEKWSGYDIPNYHKRLKTGELLPHTPFTRTSIKGSSYGAFSVYTNDSTSHWWGEPVYSQSLAWVVSEADLWSYAPQSYHEFVHEAAAKIYSNGYDALTALAELVEVRKMFVGTAKRLLTLDFPRNWKAFSSEWLSARYGWRTLVYDIMSLNEAIENLDEARTRYSERVGQKSSNTVITPTTTEKAHYYLDEVVIDRVETSIRGSVTADIVVPKFQFNPLQTGWELIPYSFVIDWFFSVGKALSALSFLSYQETYAASKGFRVEIDRTFNREIGETKSTFSSGHYNQTGTCKAVLQVRTPCSIPLNPQPTLRLNNFKVLDLIALIVQRIS